MAHAVLSVRFHLAERLGFAIRKKNRIESESKITAHWPDNLTIDGSLKHLVMTVRPGEAKGTSISSRSGSWRIAFLDKLVDPLHRLREIPSAVGRGPVGGMDSGCAVQRVDGDAAVIGQRWQFGFAGGEMRLYPGVANESGRGLRRPDQTEFTD